ncbi:hypothetical protein PENTCL1PPCAC_17669, partial [Pristionchus entomophagus]
FFPCSSAFFLFPLFLMVSGNHLKESSYILNALHLVLHIVSLFCLTVMWSSDKIYIEILDFHYWWQIFSILILLVTLLVTLIVFLGAIIERPILGFWNRKRIIVSYGVYLIFIVASAAVQTWTSIYVQWRNPDYYWRYLTSCCSTWLLALFWLSFMLSVHRRYK